MAKALVVTPEVEALIIAAHHQNTTWTAEEVRNWVRGELQNPKSIYFTPRWPEYPDWPSLSKVQKILATAKQNASKPEILNWDKPWCMGTLNEFPIPLEALSAVNAVWLFRLAKDEGFTIREAKWVARLSAMEGFPYNPAKAIRNAGSLSIFSQLYASNELMYELAGHPYDSALMDKFYMGIPAEIVIKEGEQQHGLTYTHNSAYRGIMLSLPKEKAEKFKSALTRNTQIWEAYKKEVRNEGEHKEEKQK